MSLRQRAHLPPARADGVTLIELMVGLALVALLMAPLAALLANSASGSAATALQLDLQNQAQFALARIDRQIQLTPNTQLSAKPSPASSATWLSPALYDLRPGSVAGTQGLWETIGGGTPHLLAEPVSVFTVSSVPPAAGQTLISVTLTLARGDASASVSDVARMGGAR